MLMRRQFVLTLILMPITFGIWYAAGTLFSAPAVWLCDALLQAVYPHLIDLVWLQGMKMGALTQFGMLEDEVVAASAAGNQIELEINTRLVSYSIAFTGRPDGVQHQTVLQVLHRLFCLWVVMLLGIHSAKDLLVMGAFSAPRVRRQASALTYQFISHGADTRTCELMGVAARAHPSGRPWDDIRRALRRASIDR